jgi:hypothetical protein
MLDLAAALAAALNREDVRRVRRPGAEVVTGLGYTARP